MLPLFYEPLYLSCLFQKDVLRRDLRLAPGSFAIASLLLLASEAPSGGAATTPPKLISGEITPDDYPANAHGVSGTTIVSISVDETGAVVDCKIVAPSGSTALDDHSCSLIRQRMRYEPARSADGKPVISSITRRVLWKGSSRPVGLALLQPVWVEIELIVAPDGLPRSCKVVKFENTTGESPSVACPWAIQGMRFPPIAGTKDRLVRYRNSVQISEVP
ncbi:energy transducer TonB [Sphingomonas sp. CCH5-D11]|uniref:energy transducer TonB n=1 Tax=Sphingomonas sp. CCH5-D11 TaxID=1768786 RepID=UPI0018D265CF